MADDRCPYQKHLVRTIEFVRDGVSGSDLSIALSQAIMELCDDAEDMLARYAPRDDGRCPVCGRIRCGP